MAASTAYAYAKKKRSVNIISSASIEMTKNERMTRSEHTETTVRFLLDISTKS